MGGEGDALKGAESQYESEHDWSKPLPTQAPLVVEEWKANRYEHGGARFYFERPSGNARTPIARHLILDTYSREATAWVDRALELARQLEQADREKERLTGALGAIQAVAVMSQNHHAKDVRLEWLREIEQRAREALSEQNTKPSGEVGEEA